MSTRAIATSTLWQILSQVVMAVLSAVAVKFVAMGLAKELAGWYNSAYGYLQLFSILADFGLYAVSVREAAVAKDRGRVLGALFVLRTFTTVLSLGAAIGIVWLVPVWRGSPLRMGITVAALVPFLTLLAGVLRTSFQIEYKMHLVFIAEVSQRIVTTGLMALIIFSGVRFSTDPTVYLAFLWIGVIGAAVLFALSVIFVIRICPFRPCFDRVLLLRLLRRAIPYGVAYLCIALYRQFDLTMIALLRPDFAVQNAYYGFASRITEMTYLVPTFLLNSTLPILSERHERGKPVHSLLGKTLFLVMTFGTVAATFSLFWSRPLMQLLTSDTYLSHGGVPGADTALRLLSAPQFLNGIVLFSFYVLLTKHEWRTLVSRMMVAALLSLFLNLWSVPALGFVGSIRTLTIVHLFLVLTLFPAAVRVLPLSFPRSYVIAWTGFTAVVALGTFLTAPLLTSTSSILVGLMTASIALIALAFIFRFHTIVSFGGNAEIAPRPEMDP